MRLKSFFYIIKDLFFKPEKKGLLFIIALITLIISCAKPGMPDGGLYDETPPKVVGTSPGLNATEIKTGRIHILFDEYIKVDNATENVVISPPQIESPDIKTGGKMIRVSLNDSLKQNTTYTIDFSDAISDNNEGNPLGNFTYVFSTGPQIDTLEVLGHVLDAQNLEPIKGILVGLYDNLSDTAFQKLPMLRVAKTDSRGRFNIKGVAQGRYRIFALQDIDGNYSFTQKSEKIAFSSQIIEPTSKPDIRQDTLWRDSLHIASIARVPYTHFLPDNIVLRAFTEEQTDRYFIKAERKIPHNFTLYFSVGNDSLPILKGLNFDSDDAFITISSEKKDTINYWLRDTLLVNQDTLRLSMTYLKTDSLGILSPETETLELLSKQPYERRIKEKEKAYQKWKKEQERLEKKGEPFQETMPQETMNVEITLTGTLDPDKNIALSLPSPLSRIDTSLIHLYSQHDSLWYNVSNLKIEQHDLQNLTISAPWRQGVEYSLELDSTAFYNIYGVPSGKIKKGFKVGEDTQYGTFTLNIPTLADTTLVGELLSNGEEVVKRSFTQEGRLHFAYIKPGTYYLRFFTDSNKNGVWDTGEYTSQLSPEMMYYYPEEIIVKEKWDISQNYAPLSHSLNTQKPSKIIKQKADKVRTIKNRNAERALRR